MPTNKLPKVTRTPRPTNHSTGEPEEGRRASRHVSEKRFNAVVAKHDGIYAHAARELGATRQAVLMRIKRHPHLQEFPRRVIEESGDLVESHIIEACRSGNGAMLRFYADRKPRDRGYGMRIAR